MELSDLLNKCYKLSEAAYHQEQERQKAISSKLDYLFRWLTAFIAIGNIGIPLIAKYADADCFSTAFWVMYIAIAVCLVAALVLILIIHFPRRQKYLPLGTDMIKKLQKNKKILQTETEWIYNQILYIDSITKSIEKRNNSAIAIVRVIEILFILSIVLIVTLFTYILRGA